MSQERHPITGCRAWSLFDPIWCIEADWFAQLADAAAAIPLELLARENAAADDKPEPRYQVNDGIATIPITGPITKYPSSFRGRLGGTSTIETQKALRDAVADPSVKAILLDVESRGGTVAGVPELADEIRRTDQVKPVHAAITDNGTSAAIWLATQARHITANRTARVGSIGTMAILRDESKKMEAKGVKVVPIASGALKAAGAPGTEITSEQRADFQRQITEVNEHFINAVASSRRLTADQVRGHEAKVYLADAAKMHGFIDEIATSDQAMAAMRARYVAAPQPSHPPTGADMKATAEQVGKVKALVGTQLAPQVNEDNAFDHVLACAERVNVESTALRQRAENAEARAFPRADPALQAMGMRMMKMEKDRAIASGALSQVVADELEKLFVADGKLTPLGLVPVGAGADLDNLAIKTYAILGSNRQVRAGEKSGRQSHPLERAAAPGTDDADPESKPTSDDRKRELLSQTPAGQAALAGNKG